MPALDPGTMLAETPAPVFMMSILKPAVTFAALMAYANLVTTRLLPDCASFNLPTTRWGVSYLCAAATALGAVLAIPWWWLGLPVMLAVLAVPCVAYLRQRRKMLQPDEEGGAIRPAPPILFLSIDISKPLARRGASKERATVGLRLERKDRTELRPPGKPGAGDPQGGSSRKRPDFETAEAFEALRGLVKSAIDAKASRVELIRTKELRAAWRVLSVQQGVPNVAAPELLKDVAKLLKYYAGLNLAEYRKFQEASIFAVDGDERHELTVSSFGSMQEERVRFDIDRARQLSIRMVDIPDLPGAALRDDPKTGRLSGEADAEEPERKRILKELDESGLSPDPSYSLAQVRLLKSSWADGRRGVILFGAKRGHGITSMGLSILGLHDAMTSNILTLERRVEYVMPGVTHQAYDPSKGDYATQLTSMIRRGPDVVLVTEPGEPGVAKAITSPSAAGTLFLVAIPTDSSIEMLHQWVKLTGSPQVASANLLATVSQRLLRTICPKCLEEYLPSPVEQKNLALPQGRTLKRATGKDPKSKDQLGPCPHCRGAGFAGVRAATEVIAFDDAARKLVAANDFKGAYLHAQRACRSLRMVDNAARLVRGDIRVFQTPKKGSLREDFVVRTSYAEFMRVFMPPPAKAPAPGQASTAQAAAKPGEGKPESKGPAAKNP